MMAEQETEMRVEKADELCRELNQVLAELQAEGVVVEVKATKEVWIEPLLTKTVSLRFFQEVMPEHLRWCVREGQPELTL